MKKSELGAMEDSERVVKENSETNTGSSSTALTHVRNPTALSPDESHHSSKIKSNRANCTDCYIYSITIFKWSFHIEEGL